MIKLKNETLKNIIWKFLERCGYQLLSFVVSIVLARMLTPEDFGTIAIVLAFINLLQVFVDSGLGNALIQKKDADSLDFSSVFYFNIAMCLFMYIVVFCCAPYFADIFESENLTIIIRVTSITLIISGVRNIQQAYVARHMIFKKMFFSTIVGNSMSACISIIMAFTGYGVWALVVQTLMSQTIGTVILWYTVRWRPIKAFSFSRWTTLFTYGWKLLISSLIETSYFQFQQFAIGKVFDTSSLAFYNRGQQFPEVIVDNINASINSVLLPTMSRVQENAEGIKQKTRLAITTSSFVIWPMLMGIVGCSEQLIRVILTEKWIDCVPFVCIFCITYGFMPIHTANLSAIKAIGRSDIFLMLEIIKKIIGLALIIITLQISSLAVAFGVLVTSIISTFINSFPNTKLLNYSYTEQMRDILPSFLLSSGMAVLVRMVSLFGFSDIITLFFQIIVGVIFYLASAKLLKFKSLELVIKLLRGKL